MHIASRPFVYWENGLSLVKRMNHIFGTNPLVEVFGTDIAEAKSFFLEGSAVSVCCIRDFGSLVVADVGIERRDEHQGVIQQFLDTWVVGLDTRDTVDVEGYGSIPEELCALQEVSSHDGLEDVEFEVPLHPADCDRCVVADDLSGDHRHSFALRRIDLTGHDG